MNTPFNRPFFFFTSLVLCFCRCTTDPGLTALRGETMGTTYSIKTIGANPGLQEDVDSILDLVNHLFSTYDPGSVITAINKSREKTICIDDSVGHYADILSICSDVYRLTGGSFDPTVMPLVNYWGFGLEKFRREASDPEAVDSILKLVGYHQLAYDDVAGDSLCFHKEPANVMLDLSAIAKGFGVDLISEHFQDMLIADFMIEIGGEVRTRGVNERKKKWKIGVEEPNPEGRQLQMVLKLSDLAMASSGNYRNFYEVNGRLIGHTINPRTGYPEVNDLLGVTVLAGNCAYADALATGFMVLGFERAYAVADSLPGVEAVFMRLNATESEQRTDMTPGFNQYVWQGNE